MSLGYPIADTAELAITSSDLYRTRGQASQQAGLDLNLACDWIKPTPEQAEQWAKHVETGRQSGFIQVYESASGEPTYAVSYWKEGPIIIDPPRGDGTGLGANDHTDDLYFSKANKAPNTRRRKKYLDPNQLDLFAGKTEDSD